ncbi:hypothetical protein VPNG_02092 [Cytospora leucostoma]|uniref:RNase H type-1 domain-containing protein n=1 Tax=Cytospora leucostoma TaxID=1230097 RepID=A0A423XHD7_9PEZI|nr:hypothetical protein VPNG_02092 [Cytospora leucostoma]
MPRKKSPNEPINESPHCRCQILFIPDADGKHYVPEDKIAVVDKGNFTFQVCKFGADKDKDNSNKPARKTVGSGNKPDASSTDVIHHDVIVIAVGGVCSESKLGGKGRGEGKKAGAGACVPRADAGVYLGGRNPLNGGAIVNPRSCETTPATAELAYLVGVKEALLRGMVVASASSFDLAEVAATGSGPGDDRSGKGARPWAVWINPARLAPLLGGPGRPVQVRYMAECERRAAEDMAMGGIPAEAACLSMLRHGKSHLTRIIIKCDSDYINKIVAPNMPKWFNNGYKTSRGRPIKYGREIAEVVEWTRALLGVDIIVVFWPVKRSENRQAIEMALRGSRMVPECRAVKPVIQWTQLEGEEEGLDLGMGFPPEGMRTYHDCEREKDPDAGRKDDPKGKGRQRYDPEAPMRSTKCRIYHECEDDRKCQAKRINRRIQALRKRQAKCSDHSNEDARNEDARNKDAQNEARPADPGISSLPDLGPTLFLCPKAQVLMDGYREIIGHRSEWQDIADSIASALREAASQR